MLTILQFVINSSPIRLFFSQIHLGPFSNMRSTLLQSVLNYSPIRLNFSPIILHPFLISPILSSLILLPIRLISSWKLNNFIWITECSPWFKLSYFLNVSVSIPKLNLLQFSERKMFLGPDLFFKLECLFLKWDF